MTLTFFPSVHISCRFPMPQGLYTVLKKYRDGKGLWRSLMANVGTKNGGRKGTRKYWEDTWNRAAEFPCTFLFPQLLRYWDFYCQHVLVNCSLRIVILGWTSIWYWYYNSWHCSTTLVILCWVVVGARRRFVAIVDASTCKYIQTLLQKNALLSAFLQMNASIICMLLRDFVHECAKCSTQGGTHICNWLLCKNQHGRKGWLWGKFLMQRAWGELGQMQQWKSLMRYKIHARSSVSIL